MPSNHNLVPKLVIPAIIIGAVAFAAFNQSQHKNKVSKLPAPSYSQASPSVSELPSAKCHMNGVLPDMACTPGAVNPNITQDNISSTICISGFTKIIRPTASFTNKLKAEQMTEYGFTDSIRLHEEDHLISLELGGAPSDPANLWPEPGHSPNPKDKIENFLHAAICSGRISLQEAQHRIATDWTTAEQGLTN